HDSLSLSRLLAAFPTRRSSDLSWWISGRIWPCNATCQTGTQTEKWYSVCNRITAKLSLVYRAFCCNCQLTHRLTVWITSVEFCCRWTEDEDAIVTRYQKQIQKQIQLQIG